MLAYLVDHLDMKYSLSKAKSFASSSFVNKSYTMYKNNTVDIKLIIDPNDAI